MAYNFAVGKTKKKAPKETKKKDSRKGGYGRGGCFSFYREKYGIGECS